MVLGDAQRVIQWESHDAGAEADTPRLRDQRGKRERGRRAIAVLGEVVLRGPDRVEPEVLGGDHQLPLLADGLMLGLVDGILEQVKHPESRQRPSLEHSPGPAEAQARIHSLTR